MNDYLRIDLRIAQARAGLFFGLEEEPRRYNGRSLPPRWKLAEIPCRRSGHERSLPQIVRACGRRRSRLTERRRSSAEQHAEDRKSHRTLHYRKAPVASIVANS